MKLNPLNAELNPICHLLALLGAHHILHVSRIRVNEELRNHCTRQKSDIHTQFCRTTLFKNNSANVVIKLFNKLSDTIKRLEKIQEFKRRLKYFLLQHIFFSVDEYMSLYDSLLINCLLLCTFYSQC
jgi:hypothetical protein